MEQFNTWIQFRTWNQQLWLQHLFEQELLLLLLLLKTHNKAE
jgi:hypothetical protein